MESYEDFIQRLYNSHYNDDDDDDEDESQRPSSLIVFHGARVLPPLLNEQQREEMRRLRDTAMSLMRRRREEESHVSKHCQFTDVRISDDERDALKSDDIISSAPLTSTALDGRSANQLRASPEDESQITVLFEGVGCKTHRPNDAPGDHSHSQMMMMSSGYVTNDNTDVTCHSSWIEGDGVPAGDTTRPTTTGSDIISHAPVDGAFLEEEKDVVLSSEKVTELVNPPSDPDEGPYRTSLQNLLKKSQEYRRRQRQLRSQARAAAEHSLSDKENEELLPKQTELRKAREKRKDHQSLHDEDNAQIDTLPQATALPVTARSLYVSKQNPVSVSRSSLAAGKRFTNIPTRKFCLSPVRCVKKASGIPVPVRKALTESEPSVLADGDILSSLNNGGMMSVQTEQIAQLELNLSSLKALISDLESTLTLSQTNQTESPNDNSTKQPSTVTFNETLLQEDCGISQENSNSIQTVSVVPIPTKSSRSIVGVLTDTANHSVQTNAESSLIGSSYDVDAPSSVWTQLTPETGGHEGVSRVKRRLLMNDGEVLTPGREAGRARFSTPRGMSSVPQTQEDQVTALMEEERRRQQELLQSLAVRYQFLRSASFPCPSAGSRLEDTSTSLLASSVCTHAGLTDALHTSRQRCLSLPASCRPLLAALARGFLTRRLLRTERVSRLIRTIKDTRTFLLTFQRQTAVGGRHDLMLQERVTLQLRAARHELHEIFFGTSSSDRMQMIRCDRELSRDRRLKTHDNKAKGFLSAATRKSLERKKLVMLQRKSADRKKFSPSDVEKWNLVPKICRVSKKITAR